MRLAPPTNRRRITRDATKTIAGSSYLDRKPDRYDDDCHNDCAPHRRRNLFRTPASRGVIGGVVEFLIHGARLTGKAVDGAKLRHHYLSKRRPDLVPQRRSFPVAIMFRRCRLRGAHRIGCRKTVHQTGLEFRVGVPIGQSGFAGVGGMLVVWRGIEFLSHVEPPSPVQRVGNPDVPQQVNRNVIKAV